MHKIQKQLLDLSRENNLSGKSLREIGELVGEGNSPQKIKHHLGQLSKTGLIQIDFKSRVIKNIDSDSTKLMSLPIMGAADCGPATLYADEYVRGYVRVSPKLLSKKKFEDKSKIFVIEAIGDSMNQAKVNGTTNIDDGDYVVIDGNDTSPRDGDYVLSIIDDVANVKKFVKDTKNEQIVLMSESSGNHRPIFIHKDDRYNYMISGKVIGVIKTPRLNKN